MSLELKPNTEFLRLMIESSGHLWLTFLCVLAEWLGMRGPASKGIIFLKILHCAEYIPKMLTVVS